MRIADPRQVPRGLFLYTLRPIRLAMLTDGATPDERAIAAQHWAYSQNLLAQGTLIFAGRTLQRDPTTFAFVVIRAPSLDAARVLAERDPAVAGGVFATEVFPFQPVLMGEWPAEAATVPPAPLRIVKTYPLWLTAVPPASSSDRKPALPVGGRMARTTSEVA